MNKVEETFQHIMKNYGHDVLVIHDDLNEVCSCYDPVTGSVKRTCQYCFGTGKVPQIKKYRTRYVDARVPESNVFMMNPQIFGEMAISSKTYFFYKDKKIKEGDLIMEVDWDGQRPVYNRGGIYQVAHIEKLRYIKGETSFIKVYVKDQPVNKSVRGISVVKKAGEISYLLAEDKPYNMINNREKEDSVSKSTKRFKNKTFYKENQPLKYRTKYIETDKLDAGETSVIQEGQLGLGHITEQVTYLNEKESSRAVINVDVVEEPIDKIIEIGKKEERR